MAGAEDWNDTLADLARRRAVATAMGGDDKRRARHEVGRRERFVKFGA